MSSATVNQIVPLTTPASPVIIIFMTNYAMFRCQFCDGQIDPDAGGTMHLVTGWVNVGSNSNLKVVEKNWKYAHKICVEVKPIKEQVETLF